METIGNYELSSPLINGGGVVKTVEDAAIMAHTGIGAVEAGTFTLDARVGNSPNGEKVIDYDPLNRIMKNSVGLKNPGLRQLANEDLQQMIDVVHYCDKPFILNIAPVSENPSEEILDIVSVLAEHQISGIDATLLNAGCPCVKTDDGSRHEILSYDLEQLEHTVRLLGNAASDYPLGDIFVKISPFRAETEALAISEVLGRLPVHAVVAFNTFPSGEFAINTSTLNGGIYGISGPRMAKLAEIQTIMLTEARKDTGASFDIIGSVGIIDAESMQRRLELGAAAVCAGTLFFTTEMTWAGAVEDIYNEFAELSEALPVD